ncbi:DNA repair and recombination protein RadB [Candidatus Woesearchaeota archaeon]|nr:DNA repair and recombination protein RadB [Candidatus Woesearchaeota archaeon]
MEKITSGSSAIDELLKGGYEKDIITTIYGPAGSGKTNLCLVAVKALDDEKKVLFIDTEGGFSVDRFKQMCKDEEELEEKMKRIMFITPVTFDEQKRIFSKLDEYVDENVGLLVFDSIAMLYRLEMGKGKNVQKINSLLAQQLSCLSKIARDKNIPVLITNQVYADFENKNNVKMVGGDLLKYQSKCLIELQNLKGSNRMAVIRKHRSLPEGRKVKFKIINKGIEKAE